MKIEVKEEAGAVEDQGAGGESEEQSSEQDTSGSEKQTDESDTSEESDSSKEGSESETDELDETEETDEAVEEDLEEAGLTKEEADKVIEEGRKPKLPSEAKEMLEEEYPQLKPNPHGTHNAAMKGLQTDADPGYRHPSQI